ncbi:putative non-specific serine/threonine protein kinase [Dioscorea sansibarensis]
MIYSDSRVSEKVFVCMDSWVSDSSEESRHLGFKEGDLVWAKAFPYRWWPGSITRIMSSSALVSFFGCDKARCFDFLEIRGFEEAYPWVSKMVHVKLSEEIRLALEELSRKSTLGMICSCGSLDLKLNRCVKEKKVFEPKDMLGFLLDVAIDVSASVSNLATGVRLSAQLVAYRRSVSLCHHGELSGGFDPDGVLDFVLGAAVSPSNAAEESFDLTEALRQVNAYRNFILVHPDWRYQQSLDLEVDSLENEFDRLEETSTSNISELSEDIASDICEGSEQEMISYASLHSACGVNGQKDDDFSWPIHDKDSMEVQERVPEGQEICMLNTVDFSALEQTEDDLSMLDNLSEAVVESSGNNDWLTNSQSETVASICASVLDSNANNESLLGHQYENFDELSWFLHDQRKDNECVLGKMPETFRSSGSSAGTDSCMEEVSVENSESNKNLPESYVKLTTSENFSLMRDVEEATAIHQNKEIPCINADPCPEKNSDVQTGRMSLIASKGENVKEQHENATDASPKSKCLTLLPLSSDHITFPKNPPCLERFPASLANHCDGLSADGMLMCSVKSHSNDYLTLTINCKIEDQGTVTDTIPGSSAFVETGTFERMKIDESIFSVDSCKLQRTLFSYAKDIAHDNSVMGEQSFASFTTHSCSEVIDGNQIDENGPTLDGDTSVALKLHSGDVIPSRNITKSDKMEGSCSFSPVASKSISCINKGLELPQIPRFSDCHRYYVSPLTPDVSKPVNGAKKPLVGNKQSSFSKSLHMKFPKDFKLPSAKDLEKKFGRFGPLDRSRTKISFYTGAGQVVFIHIADAKAAYKYVTRKNIFGGAYVRFWFDKYEKFRKECITECSAPMMGHTSPHASPVMSSPIGTEWSAPTMGHISSHPSPVISSCIGTECSAPTMQHTTSHPSPVISLPIVGNSSMKLMPVISTVGNSSQNLKSCLKRPIALEESDKRIKSKVRFVIETG